MTTVEIYKNQQTYKEKIVNHFSFLFGKTRKKLSEISCEDEEIMKNRKNMLDNFNKEKAMKSIEKYFLKSKDDKKTKITVWWNHDLKKAELLKNDIENPIQL